MISRTVLTWQQKQDIARIALSRAIEARGRAGVGSDEPVPAWLIAERLGAPVRFLDIDMEGMYRREPSPRIFVSAHRPLPRRNFTCGHEIGHHVFGHGAMLDDAQTCAPNADYDNPDEYLANIFAAHLLMPVLGIRSAFARRGIAAGSATPAQILTVAAEFGVGYQTLVTHLTYSLRDLSPAAATRLVNDYRKLRKSLLPDGEGGPVVVVDQFTRLATLDIEVGHLVLAPPNAVPDETILVPVSTAAEGRVFRSVRRGAVEVADPSGSWCVMVRVARRNFVGLARFQFLNDEENDDSAT